jgi:hypothetical protein
MADTFTTNLNLTKPEVGASTDTWGTKLNADLDTVDGLFSSTGTSVAMNLDGAVIDSSVIGGTTAAAGSFTTLSASTSITGTLATAAQPNITSVGTLTSLNVAGTPTFDGLTVDGSADISGTITAGANNGVIKEIGSDLSLVQGAVGLRINDASSAISPTTASANNDNAVDLGVSNIRFKDIYLSGKLTNDGSGGISVDTSGNVGIGTSSPTTQLHISGTSNNTFIRIDDGSEFINIGVDATGSFYNTNTNHRFLTASGGTEALRITDTGLVGIGTTSPSALLGLNASAPDFTMLQSDSVKFRMGVSGTTNGGVTGSASGDYFARTAGGKMLFSTNDGVTAHAVINSSGNVGIGTSSPTDKVQILDSGNLALRVESSGASNQSAVWTENNSGAINGMFIYGSSHSTYGAIGAGEGAFYSNTNINIMSDTASGTIKFSTGSSGGSERMRIDSSGNVGIGATSVGARLHVRHEVNRGESSPHLQIQGLGYAGFHWLDGTAYYIGQNSNSRHLRMYSGSNDAAGVNLASGATSFGTYSDERLKENIQDIGSVIEKIKDIRCVTYTRKDVDDENKHETIGFIAQDFVGKFDQVLDESKVLDSDEETRYSMRYTETVPILMKAIQEQQTQIEALQSEINLLKGE